MIALLVVSKVTGGADEETTNIFNNFITRLKEVAEENEGSGK